MEINLKLSTTQAERIATALERLATAWEGFVEPKPNEVSRPEAPFGPSHLEVLSDDDLWEQEQEVLRQHALGQLPTPDYEDNYHSDR